MNSRRPPILPAALGPVLVALALGGPASGAEPPFLKGADVSMLPDIEAHGGVYTDAGAPGDLLDILQSHGVNAVRLRLWHTPAGGSCGLARTLAMAERIRAHGMTFLLDLHYSDTWADPGKQRRPAAWTGLPSSALRDSVYRYTFDVMTALRERNALPDLVQIGNEVICGMLWDDGRVCGAFDTPEQWERFAGLVDAGVRGVRESLTPPDSVRIVIHVDRGGDAAGTRWFFDSLLARGVDFDVIGLSYYPWWHGTLDDLRATLDSTAARYGMDILVVEAAYPWTLGWYDDTHNIVGLPGQLHAGYPATVDGQGEFLGDLLELVARTPDARGRGVFYWAPEHISTPTLGSPWENVTLFDFQGGALASLAAFGHAPTAVAPAGPPAGVTLGRNVPNPVRRSTTIRYAVAAAGRVRIGIYDVRGTLVAPLVDAALEPGEYTATWDGRDAAGSPVPPGIYFYRHAGPGPATSRKLTLLP